MTAQPETLTILFTDLVNSTELLQRVGEETAQRIFEAHHRLLREAVAAHGGAETQWTGDGLMVAFGSATTALRCAIAMQQTARRPAAGARLQIRVGLQTGETLRHEVNDYFGSTVVIASRLCALAQAGEILCPEIVRALVPDASAFQFRDRGELMLKGIARPIRTWSIKYSHDPLAMLTHTPFVGREAESAVLRAKLGGARAGKGAVVMLVGEPGIGKTRTIEEFAAHARSQGARVLAGRCYDGEWAPPFSPFVEALRDYARETPAGELAAALGPDAGVLARIVPQIREVLPDVPEPPALQADGERYRLLDAVADVLGRIAGARPLALVLDDLHWADKGTIAMLRHVARSAAAKPVLIIGAYRDVELDRQHPLAAALADLRHETSFERIPLKGLDKSEVGELLDVIAEQDVPRPLVDAIAVETNGNPFFIKEVLLHLVEERKIVQEDGRWTSSLSIAEMGIPEGVREVIGRRLSRLSDACNRMLTAASAMTGGFSWAELQAICEEPERALLDALDEALRAQVLLEAPGAAATYDFTHALIRHTLYEELSTPRRLLLHRRIGEALESLYAEDIEPHLAELAHHFYEAGDASASKAIEYASRAAEQHIRMAAYDDASALLSRAASMKTGIPVSRRAKVLERLADVMFMSGIDWRRGRDALEEAVGLYEAAGDRERLAQAHSRLGRALSSMARDAHDISRAKMHYARARELLKQMPPNASLGYVEVGLANAALFGVETGEGLEASERAMSIAQQIGHEVLWANAATLHGFHSVNAGEPDRGLDFIERAWRLAHEHNHAATAFLAAWHMGHIFAHLVVDPCAAHDAVERELELPRVAGADLLRNMLQGVRIDAYLLQWEVESARELDQQIEGQGQQFRSAAYLEGRYDDASRRIDRALRFGAESGANWHVWIYSDLLAEIFMALDHRAKATSLLQRALTIAISGRNRAAELRVRGHLAVVMGSRQHVDVLAENLERCRSIVTNEAEWRGSAGYLRLAEAGLSAAQGDLAAARACLARASQAFEIVGAKALARPPVDRAATLGL